MERRAAAFGCVAVPAPVFELLAQQLICQRVVRFLEISTEAENSAVDARLGFAIKVRTVVEALKDEVPVDAVDHSASLLTGRIQSEVLQDHETVESYKVPLPAAPNARRSLTREKLGAPAFAGDAGAFGRDRG